MSGARDNAIRQHTPKEWEEVRQVIVHLYVKDMRPLSTMMQIMDTDHGFKASVAMYKRTLRNWGIRKNKPSQETPSRSKSRITTSRGQRPVGLGAPGVPRYLAQNDADEALHTLIDLVRPWIEQAGWPRYQDIRLHCWARAAYSYDSFSSNIAVATAAFEAADTTRGGVVLRQAFIDLEDTLTPEIRSMFTLHGVFFALATLNTARLFDASRLLVVHAARLVMARTRTHAPVHYSKSLHERLLEERGRVGQWDDDEGGEGGKEGHPLPQIMKRLQVLRQASDDITFTQAVFRAWAAYYQSTQVAVTTPMFTNCAEREYWEAVFEEQRCPTFTTTGPVPWREMVQPVLDKLHRLVEYGQASADVDIIDLCQSELVSGYFFSKDEKFEEMALERVAQVGPGQRGWSATFELAEYYFAKGHLDRSLGTLTRIIPEHMANAWQTVIMEAALGFRKQNSTEERVN